MTITHVDVDEYCDALDQAMASNPHDLSADEVERHREHVVAMRTSLHKVIDEP